MPTHSIWKGQMMEQIRSFIAVELPEEVKSGLRQVQETLKSTNPSCARWVDPYSIHLTLKFLGNVDANKIDVIVRSIKKAVQPVTPFRLEVKGVGFFPSLQRVQVVWIGLTGDIEKLQLLQNNIETEVSPLGFPTEKRAFTPHLTLARLRDNAGLLERQKMGEIIAKTEIETNMIIQVSSISLMRSQLTRNGAIYTRLSSIGLSPSC
jgi:2'-5' RNA ligase